MLSFFPRDVLDKIWDLIGSVSEGFPIYFFKQSPEARYAVPVYIYLMQREVSGPWNFGQFAEIFQRGEDNSSSGYLIHLQKAKELRKEEKSYALLPFYKIY